MKHRNDSAATAETPEQIIEHISRLMAEAEAMIAGPVAEQASGKFAEMNSVWDAWVAPGNTPARATVEAKLASPAHLVEIMVVAVTT